MHTQAETFTASLQQKRLWAAQQQSRADHLVEALVEVSAEISGDQIRDSLRTIASRHEVLRTRLVPGTDGAPVQQIDPEIRDDLFVHRTVESETLDLDLSADVERCPGPILPFSATLFRSTKNSKRWLRLCAFKWNCDPQSMLLIVKELDNLLAGGEPTPEALQHADYAAWQEESGAKPGSFTHLPEWQSVKLPGERTSAAKRSNEERVERSNGGVLKNLEVDEALALWAGYLSRVTEQTEFHIMVPRREEAEEQIANAVGPYEIARTIRCLVSPESSLASLKAQLRIDDDASAQGEAAFGFQTIDLRVEGLRFLKVVQTATSPDFAKACLQFTQTKTEARFTLAFDGNLIPMESASRILDGFLTFAERCKAAPDELLSAAPLVGSEEREMLIHKFQRARVTFDLPSGVEKLVEDAAAKSPESVAVSCGSASLTYAELNQKANALANHLRGLGIGEDHLVGLATVRSVETVVGLLGILKSGAAYVPLDPNYPANRLQAMIDEANVSFIVTSRGAKLPANSAKSVLLEGAIAQSGNAVAPNSSTNSNRAAYVIFTSGSTGKPKGVTINHSSLLQSTFARLHYYPGKVENYLLVSSFAFDSSVAGIFWTLAQGGTLTLPEEGLHQDPDALVKLIEVGKVSHFLALPSLYNAVLDRAKNLSSLRVVIVAGEACPPELLKRHNEQVPQAGLYNEYGPTEGTVWATVFRCNASEVHTTVPIGKPIPNWQTFIVDSKLNLCPMGVAGELLVGGPGLARGYLNRPDLTDAKFIPNPFTPDYSARLYRTGDLVRLNGDGNIEFLGRIDHQVKIRGFRIELEEIENAIRAQADVHECIVIAREDGPGGKQLVAYFTPKASQRVNAETLRAALAQQLPEHMIPSAFVQLDAFPLNPNGKVDRQALPAPERRSASGAENESLNPIETEVAAIMRTLLNLEAVKSDESFFVIGGNSLLAMQLISRIRDHFKAEVSLRSFFQDPTIRGLAKAVDAGRSGAKTPAIKRAQRGNARTLLADNEAKPA